MQRHLVALAKQLREQAVVEKSVKRARELAQVAQYRRFLCVMHSSPADLKDEEVIAALSAIHPHRELVTSLPPSFIPTAATTSQKLMKRVLRKMENIRQQTQTACLYRTSSFSSARAREKKRHHSGLSVLQDFSCLMVEGGVSAKAANYHA